MVSWLPVVCEAVGTGGHHVGRKGDFLEAPELLPQSRRVTAATWGFGRGDLWLR